MCGAAGYALERKKTLSNTYEQNMIELVGHSGFKRRLASGQKRMFGWYRRTGRPKRQNVYN